ncbi:uncharacterized protein [Aegilops tauschii subsp. strangulata]|uniref:uncharacterized protein n=1 Tax=Aegilops tauschii subsp. strangulata TaxID=200361 RepID=UPI00098B335D|nr:uncharacterized protein LOC109782121 [Aegilops tauschii subsp. strangulata]
MARASLTQGSESGKDLWPLAIKMPHATASECRQWSAPTEGTIKINSDASYLPDTGNCWAGALARNYRGQIMLCIGKQMLTSNSVEEAEAKAALCGLQTLASIYTGPVEVELDCRSVIKELSAAGPSLSPCYAVIQDIKATLCQFASHKLSFAGRECNKLAHELATEARKVGDLHIVGGVPERLRAMMLKECSTHPE